MSPTGISRVKALAIAIAPIASVPIASLMIALVAPSGAGAHLSTRNTTPFPTSKLIVGARWTSPRYGPPANQWGDILPTVWGDDGDQYVMMDDGGTDVPVSGGIWRQSVGRISGTPPRIRFSLVGNSHVPPAHTLAEIQRNPKLWQGPLGPYYSSGMVEVDGIFYATQENDWKWGVNGPFAGLNGIAYSADRGRNWSYANKPFSAPLGNLSWMIRGRGGSHTDGYVYAIATEREFNASNLILGRAPPGVAGMTDPAQWQWVTGWQQVNGEQWPVFSSSLAAAVPIVSWGSRITYPQISYDSPIHRYLLTFSFSYAIAPPGIWQDGAELVILEGAHPWGPFSFVAREGYFGPSNGYDPGFPVGWISRSGRYLWMKWAANFAGCQAHLDCSGGYGFNYRQLHLTLAGDR